MSLDDNRVSRFNKQWLAAQVLCEEGFQWLEDRELSRLVVHLVAAMFYFQVFDRLVESLQRRAMRLPWLTCTRARRAQLNRGVDSSQLDRCSA